MRNLDRLVAITLCLDVKVTDLSPSHCFSGVGLWVGLRIVRNRNQHDESFLFSTDLISLHRDKRLYGPLWGWLIRDVDSMYKRQIAVGEDFCFREYALANIAGGLCAISGK